MRDKLDGLRDMLVKLSRVPGLGFLERQGDSLTLLKHQVEAHISSLETKKQGLEDGTEVVRDLFRRKSKSTEAGGQPVATGGKPVGGKSAGSKSAGGGQPGAGSAPEQERQLAGKLGGSRRQPADIGAQKKQLLRKLKR